jgi:hypothetical protein
MEALLSSAANGPDTEETTAKSNCNTLVKLEKRPGLDSQGASTLLIAG